MGNAVKNLAGNATLSPAAVAAGGEEETDDLLDGGWEVPANPIARDSRPTMPVPQESEFRIAVRRPSDVEESLVEEPTATRTERPSSMPTRRPSVSPTMPVPTSGTMSKRRYDSAYSQILVDPEERKARRRA